MNLPEIFDKKRGQKCHKNGDFLKFGSTKPHPPTFGTIVTFFYGFHINQWWLMTLFFYLIDLFAPHQSVLWFFTTDPLSKKKLHSGTKCIRIGNLSSFHILLFFDILREEIQETSIWGGEKRILDENAAALCKTIKIFSAQTLQKRCWALAPPSTVRWSRRATMSTLSAASGTNIFPGVSIPSL